MIIISNIPPEFYERTNEDNRRSSNKTKKGDFKSILLNETSEYDPNDVLRYFSSKRRWMIWETEFSQRRLSLELWKHVTKDWSYQL